MNLWLIAPLIPLIAIALVLVLTTRKKLQEQKAGFPAKDERTERIDGRASSFALKMSSWLILGLLAYLLISNELSRNFELELLRPDAGYALVFAVLSNSLLYLLFRWYFSRKVDKV